MSKSLDAAWAELLLDALASDGPIRDSDVKDAVKRNRPHIEREAAAVLDVERLAEALFRTVHERLRGGADGLGLGSHEADAACIAAEYARLAAEGL